jgi:hypothetical protein
MPRWWLTLVTRDLSEAELHLLYREGAAIMVELRAPEPSNANGLCLKRVVAGLTHRLPYCSSRGQRPLWSVERCDCNWPRADRSLTVAVRPLSAVQFPEAAVQFATKRSLSDTVTSVVRTMASSPAWPCHATEGADEKERAVEVRRSAVEDVRAEGNEPGLVRVTQILAELEDVLERLQQRVVVVRHIRDGTGLDEW